MKASLCEVSGLIKQLLDVWNGKDDEMWIEATKRFLRRENPWTAVGKPTIGRLIATVTLGTYSTTAKLRKALEAAGHRIGDWAGDILAKTPISKKCVELDLYEVTVGDLGFANGATRADIYRRATELGFVTVPAEAGPLLRLALPNQANGEWLLIGMEPLTGRDGNPDVFDVGRDDDGSWLDALCVSADNVWNPGYRWVFGRAR
jgi:hypothetical protein